MKVSSDGFHSYHLLYCISIYRDWHFKWLRVVSLQSTKSHLWHIVCHIPETVSAADCDIEICYYSILNKLNSKQIWIAVQSAEPWS